MEEVEEWFLQVLLREVRMRQFRQILW
jgi:hypothetical protein